MVYILPACLLFTALSDMENMILKLDFFQVIFKTGKCSFFFRPAS